MLAAALAALLAALAVPTPARAQQGRSAPPPSADAASGDVDATERARYAASRREPRNPTVRAALGEWLASRGQLRSGAVLLEEARLFGGDAAAIAARLAHIYLWLRDWPSLVALPASSLSPGEQRRAAVLAERVTSVTGDDSTVVPFAPLEIGTLGRVPIVLGVDTLWGEIDPQAEGIVLPGLGRGAGLVEVLGEDRRGTIGVLRECALGALTLRDVPMRVDPSLGAGRARVGFDVFASLAPTVDARAGTAVLRRTGRAGERPGATGVPFLLGFPGVRLALRANEPALPITAPAARAALRGHRWTVDLLRGVIWVDATR